MTLAVAADMTAVVVFAAIGRVSHHEPDGLLPLLGTASPFLAGLATAWVHPALRHDPVRLRSGLIALGGAAGVGLLLRAGFEGQLPLTFATITVVTLGLLLVGWRGLSAVVARQALMKVRSDP